MDQKKNNFAENTVSFSIVYDDGSEAFEKQAGKEIIGIIFRLEGKEVFIDSSYSSGVMSKREAEAYCANLRVRGCKCDEGALELWAKDGLLGRNLERINQVLAVLGLEKIDNRWIWTSFIYFSKFGFLTYYSAVNPITGEANWYYAFCTCYHVRRVRVWE